MSFFLRVSKRSALCIACGTMVGDRDAQRTKHLASEFHASAVTAETYRHRDDTPHAVTGPLGCYVCAKLRQFEREGS